MKIVAINYNWYYTPECGEAWTNRTVGVTYNENNPSSKVTCENIKEHSAQGEGDKWYYDISYSDGSIERIFNPNQVFFEEVLK